MEFTAILRKGVSAAGRDGRVALLLLLGAIFLALVPVCRAADAPLRALSYTMTGDAGHMQVTVEFDREPDVRWFLLRGPDRMVIDLPATRFSFEPDAVVQAGDLVSIFGAAVDAAMAGIKHDGEAVGRGGGRRSHPVALVD